MFRTARGFLLVGPAAFLLTLISFLIAHPRAPDSFAPYAFMVDALGRTLARQPLARFLITSIALFIPPYLVTGLLLFFADVGVSAAAPLWRGKRRGGPSTGVPPESHWTFLAVAATASIWIGASLHRVARGGELPGGINVSPLFVVGGAFVAIGLALLAAGVVAVPRAVWNAVAHRTAR
jgi:hypothetical protein